MMRKVVKSELMMFGKGVGFSLLKKQSQPVNSQFLRGFIRHFSSEGNNNPKGFDKFKRNPKPRTSQEKTEAKNQKETKKIEEKLDMEAKPKEETEKREEVRSSFKNQETQPPKEERQRDKEKPKPMTSKKETEEPARTEETQEKEEETENKEEKEEDKNRRTYEFKIDLTNLFESKKSGDPNKNDKNNHFVAAAVALGVILWIFSSDGIEKRGQSISYSVRNS